MYLQVLEHLLTHTASFKRFQYSFRWFIVTVWGCWGIGYLSDQLLPTSFHYLCKLTFWLSCFIQSDNDLKTKDQELQQPLRTCSQLLFVPFKLNQFTHAILKFHIWIHWQILNIHLFLLTLIECYLSWGLWVFFDSLYWHDVCLKLATHANHPVKSTCNLWGKYTNKVKLITHFTQNVEYIPAFWFILFLYTIFQNKTSDNNSSNNNNNKGQ